VEEVEAGLTVGDLEARFERYMNTARALQAAYRGKMDIAVGFETEGYTGAIELARELVQRYRPDYVVGSVHHVHDQMIDFSPELYGEAALTCGGLEELYCAYFDRQYELLSALRPGVVGHFDLIRIFDPGYRETLTREPVRRRVERNLQYVAGYGGVLDLNVRALLKGAREPYISRRILVRALELGIAVCPGDDSHGVASVGSRIEDALVLLESLGVSGAWRLPVG
jgi:histidinol-phosphatase (PHP family)